MLLFGSDPPLDEERLVFPGEGVHVVFRWELVLEHADFLKVVLWGERCWLNISGPSHIAIIFIINLPRSKSIRSLSPSYLDIS